ncbi:hypothetical protein V2G26_020803 [Clonostachys chloroleuca]
MAAMAKDAYFNASIHRPLPGSPPPLPAQAVPGCQARSRSLAFSALDFDSHPSSNPSTRYRAAKPSSTA